MKIDAKVIGGDVESQKLILQANIPFVFLRDKVKFTHMKDDLDDPMNDNDTESQEYYQRRVDSKRIATIKKHIRDSILNQKKGKSVCVLFPTALLLATSREDSAYHDQTSINIENLLPSEESRFYIVDGQHRMQAMIELFEEVVDSETSLFPASDDPDLAYILDFLNKYEFNCSILLNFDLWEQAKIFADINFKQKTVDKSLYYAIYGLLDPDAINDIQTSAIFISHSIVKHLNNNVRSPLIGLVKMLKNGRGTVSQAFMADSLIKNLQSRRGIWFSESTTILEKVPYFAEESVKFFNIIKSLFPSLWPQETLDGIESKSILTKTTGMGALLRLLVYVHKATLGNYQYDQPGVRQYLLKKYMEDAKWLMSPLKEYGEELFGLNGIYSGTGGKGLESKLYRRMVEIIEKGLPILNGKKIVNGIEVGIAICRDSEGIFSFRLSHYFQNLDQMAPYRPGGGSLGECMYQLRSRLSLYFNQVEPSASAHPT
ncbi:MAG: DGQHR domain-containing protein [Clostridia bacterium]|nr:DGQHR domain-containing protein [Clostridia bacterium]